MEGSKFLLHSEVLDSAFRGLTTKAHHRNRYTGETMHHIPCSKSTTWMLALTQPYLFSDDSPNSVLTVSLLQILSGWSSYLS